MALSARPVVTTLVSTSFTTIVGVIGFFTSASDRALNYFLDPWILLDATLVAVLAYFVFRKSRFAATSIFIYFLISKLIQLLDLGRISFGLGGLVTIIMGLFFFTAMRATYIWHKEYREDVKKVQPKE